MFGTDDAEEGLYAWLMGMEMTLARLYHGKRSCYLKRLLFAHLGC
jgi:hypothetical protein